MVSEVPEAQIISLIEARGCLTKGAGEKVKLEQGDCTATHELQGWAEGARKNARDGWEDGLLVWPCTSSVWTDTGQVEGGGGAEPPSLAEPSHLRP